MKKNIFLVLGGLIVFFFGLIFGIILTLSYSFGKNLGCNLALKEIETKFQIEKGFPKTLPSIPEKREIFSSIGEITKIENQTIILKARILEGIPSKEEKFETKKVKIGETTEIVKLVEKKPEEIEKTPTQEKAKEPFKEERISFSDLKVGDEIVAISKENILEKEEFLASKIVKLLAPIPK